MMQPTILPESETKPAEARGRRPASGAPVSCHSECVVLATSLPLPKTQTKWTMYRNRIPVCVRTDVIQREGSRTGCTLLRKRAMGCPCICIPRELMPAAALVPQEGWIQPAAASRRCTEEESSAGGRENSGWAHPVCDGTKSWEIAG